MKNLKAIFAVLILAGAAFAQQGLTVQFQSAGTPIFTAKKWLAVNCSTGVTCTYTNGVIVMTAAGGGSGTVTSVTFTGDGTVLSSTPSSAVTTTGTLTAALATAAAGTVLGNPTGSTAAPAYTTAPVVTSITTGIGAAGAPTISPRAGTAIGLWSSGVGQLSLNTASATSTIGLYAAAVNIANFQLTATNFDIRAIPTNGNLQFTTNVTSSTNTTGFAFQTTNPWTGTTTGFYHSEFRGQFAPTSGTSNFTNIMSDPTINQTGGANGTVRVLAAYPINTALVGNEYLLALGTASAILPSGTLTDKFLVDSNGKVTVSSPCAASGTAANPSVVSCSTASAGIVYCDVAASAGTCTINTTAVTANSLIWITPSGATADGTILSKTCNTATTFAAVPILAAKVAATSFTINMPTVVTNGACFEYRVVN